MKKVLFLMTVVLVSCNYWNGKMIYEYTDIRVTNNSSSDTTGVSIVAMLEKATSDDFGDIQKGKSSNYKRIAVASLEQLLISPGMWNTINSAYLHYNNGSPMSFKIFDGYGKSTSADQSFLKPNSSYSVILTDSAVSLSKD